MEERATILQHKEKIERGGKEVRSIGEQIRHNHSAEESKKLAYDLFQQTEPAIKMVAVFLFGILAVQMEDTLLFHALCVVH